MELVSTPPGRSALYPLPGVLLSWPSRACQPGHQPRKGNPQMA